MLPIGRTGDPRFVKYHCDDIIRAVGFILSEVARFVYEYLDAVHTNKIGGGFPRRLGGPFRQPAERSFRKDGRIVSKIERAFADALSET